MDNNKIKELINNNKKVLFILGLEAKNSMLKDIEIFIKENFGVTKEEFDKKIGKQKREDIYPILEKEFENEIRFVYINSNEIKELYFFEEIEKEMFCLPTNVFVKDGKSLQIKHGYDTNYLEFKNILNEFKIL